MFQANLYLRYVEDAKIVDAVLEELMTTSHSSISIGRALKKRGIDIPEDRIAAVEEILRSKSLIEKRRQNTQGSEVYSLSDTGEDFLKRFNSYSAYQRGIERERRKVKRVNETLAANSGRGTDDHEVQTDPLAVIAAVDHMLNELGKTTQPSVSIDEALENTGVDLSDGLIREVANVLRSRSLASIAGKNSKGDPKFTLGETGVDFITRFGTYAAYMEGVEKEKKKVERTKNRKTKKVSKGPATALETESLDRKDRKTVDVVLQELKATNQSSLSVSRILKNSRIQFTDKLIASIENVLTARSLVIEMGRNSAGNRSYALAETGQDFIRTFGSYSDFLKGVEKENRKVERARKKKPYMVPNKSRGDTVMTYRPPNEGFFSRHLRKWVMILFIGVILYLISQSKWMGI